MAAREWEATRTTSAAFSAASSAYRRRRSSGDGDESLLDEMLEELGIPDSDKKKKRAVNAGEPIELITPPRPLRRRMELTAAEDEETKGDDNGDSEVVLLDLTTPTPPSAKRRSPRQSRASIVDLLSSPDGPDPEPKPLSPWPSQEDNEGEDRETVSLLLRNVTERSASRRRPLIQRLREAEEKTDEDADGGGDCGGILKETLVAAYEGPVLTRRPEMFVALSSEDEQKEEDDEEEAEDDDVVVWEGFDWDGPGLMTGGSSQTDAPALSTQEPRDVETTRLVRAEDEDGQLDRREDDDQERPAPKKSRAKQPRQRKPKQPKAPPRPVKAPVIAAIAMERSFALSDVGQAIHKALDANVYNNKPVPYVMENPFPLGGQNVIQWHRRGGSNSENDTENDASRYTIALHYPAEAFLSLVLDKGYNALIKILETLRRSMLLVGEGKKSVTWGTVVLVVEGMDRAIILRKKKGKSKAAPASNPPPVQSNITFSDLHELAFRVFMDTSVHTKFTCDSEATASYVALLTREIVVAAVKQTAQEEFLESVPRIHSFRVLPKTGSTLNPFANAWLRMLQMIPGVSEDRAQSVLDHYPTLRSLLDAYNDPKRSVMDKEDLLTDKLHGSRAEPSLSRRIYRVFSGWDERALV